MGRMLGRVAGWLRGERVRRNGPAILVLAVGTALSFSLFFRARLWEQQRLQADFRSTAEHYVSVLTRDLELHRQELVNIGAFYAGSHSVERDEFHEFVKPFLHTHRADTDVKALAWARRVPRDEKAECERQAQSEGYPQFHISSGPGPLGGQTPGELASRDYLPIYYLEPYLGNESALGFDLNSQEALFEAMSRAGDTGELTANSRFELAPITGDERCSLLFLPTYQNDAPIDSLVNRRQHLIGFVVGVFRIPAMLDEMAALKPTEALDA